MNFSDVFARNLRRLRAERGWTQQELADLADIDRTYLSALERGAYSATIDMIAKIAGAFGVEPAFMLRDHDG
ncbi:MAG TPA: helix-turn-helix transcriptional regulator [Rhizomicrobium sp.]|nr:helix-turn-helix transcriptional regulator [Rhizomicrobium sp.]